MVRLIVVDDSFGPNSAMLDSVREGWPWILSALKSLLETDEALGVAPGQGLALSRQCRLAARSSE